MAKAIELQPWTTLQGDAYDYEIVQEVQDWVDTSGHSVGTTTLEIYDLSDADFILEGCDDLNGVFTAINSFSSAPAAPAVYKNLLRVMSMGSPDRLYTYLRWRVMPTNVNWRVTFRVNAVLK